MSLDYQISNHDNSQNLVADNFLRPTSKKNIRKVINESFISILRKSKNNKALSDPFINQVRFNSSRTHSRSEEVGERLACKYCSRLFIKERIEIHQKICEINFKNHRFSTKTPQKLNKKGENKNNERSINSIWRKQHKDLINKLRGIDSSSEYEDYILCPDCGRKFAAGPGEKHIKKCKEIINKPKALYKNEMRCKNRYYYLNEEFAKISPKKLTPELKQLNYDFGFKLIKVRTGNLSLLEKIKQDQPSAKRSWSILKTKFGESVCDCGEKLPNRAVYCMICGNYRFNK
jgi:hypothetical protein